jgi:Cytochrome bd-type quinol oxidase, subunit 1
MIDQIPLQPDLLAARWQMALSLGWHIVIACFGVGFPVLILFAEWLGLRGDKVYLALAQRWARAAGVLFAIGAVSGTILSFEMGILWPGLIGTYGSVIGLPFALEGIAFFIEAIFLGIYLYGWGHLAPRAHLLSGLPIPIAGVASAWFVVTANAWMNQPSGFRLVDGQVTDVDPFAAIFNPATAVQTTHMIVAAFMVAGFGVASVYAWALLRGRRSAYERRGFLIGFVAAALLTVPQIVVGDWAARFLAEYQPIKLAAIEGLYVSQRQAPLTIGGLPIDGKMLYGIQIRGGLSWLAFQDVNAEVQGLDATPPGDGPPVLPVHVAFQLMVGIGFGLLFLSLWLAWSWWRKRRIPASRLFLLACVAAGPAAALALEAGWIVTEVGRQPWIVYKLMRVEEAVTAAAGIRYGLFALIALYTALTVAAVFVLRRLAASPLDLADAVTPGIRTGRA